MITLLSRIFHDRGQDIACSLFGIFRGQISIIYDEKRQHAIGWLLQVQYRLRHGDASY